MCTMNADFPKGGWGLCSLLWHVRGKDNGRTEQLQRPVLTGQVDTLIVQYGGSETMLKTKRIELLSIMQRDNQFK